jgi:hypothetical protein
MDQRGLRNITAEFDINNSPFSSVLSSSRVKDKPKHIITHEKNP